MNTAMFSADIDYAALAYAAHRANETLEEQERIVRARLLAEGTLDDALLQELQNNLMASVDAKLVPELFNLYDAVVYEIVARLNVIGLIDRPSTRQRPNPEAQSVDWAENWWTLTGMDALQHPLWLYTIRDGEAYLMLNSEMRFDQQMLIPYVIEAYTDPEVDGDGQGARAHWFSNNRSAEPDYYTKRWIEDYKDDNDQTRQRNRITIYIPHRPDVGQEGRIEKYLIEGTDLIPFQDEGDPGHPIPWPAPLPIIRFTTPYIGPVAKHATGAQVLFDNLIVALTGLVGLASVPPIALVGSQPTTDGKPPESDGSNLIKLGPNRIIAWPNKHPDDLRFQPIHFSNMREVLLTIDKVVALTALTTRTPSLIQKISTTPEAAETLKQRDIYPTALTEVLQTGLGNSLTKLFWTIQHLATHLKTQDTTDAGPDAAKLVHALWATADVRGILNEAQQLAAPEDPIEPTETATSSTQASAGAQPD